LEYGLQVLLEKKEEIEYNLEFGHHLPKHIEMYEKNLKDLDVAIEFFKNNLE
jgi:hypothetical protein